MPYWMSDATQKCAEKISTQLRARPHDNLFVPGVVPGTHREGSMRFMDVVQQGVMQAYALAPRWKRGRLTTPERARRLLEYKTKRVRRFIFSSIEGMEITFD